MGNDTNWQRQAKCRTDQINPDLFFQADTWAPTRDRLRRVCGVCPVRARCLRENLTVPFGMFGGLTRRERAALAATRGIHMTHYTAFFETSVRS